MPSKNITVVVNLLRSLDLESLKNPEVVANLVRAFGLVAWGPSVFGKEEQFRNTSMDVPGIYQTPDQIAKALVYLSQFEIKSYCEIGVFQGGNYLFVAEYLKRFNPDIKCLGIDPTGFLHADIQAMAELSDWFRYAHVTSDLIKDRTFDLVFIDGDHSLEWVTRDYNNTGKQSKICMFHDIQETTCPDIIKFWEGMKSVKGVVAMEFLDNPSDVPLHGIGVIHRVKDKGKA